MERCKLLLISIWRYKSTSKAMSVNLSPITSVSYFVVFWVGMTLLHVPSIDRTKKCKSLIRFFWLYVKTVKFIREWTFSVLITGLKRADFRKWWKSQEEGMLVLLILLMVGVHLLQRDDAMMQSVKLPRRILLTEESSLMNKLRLKWARWKNGLRH